MTLKLFTPADAACLLIDFQVGTLGWVGSTDQGQIAQRAIALAGAVKGLGMPLVLTSSLEDQAQGPILPQLAELVPEEFAARIKRTGQVNAMDNADFAAAVAKTGRSNFIVAGITNDVCTIYPTMTLLAQGNRVEVVADAGGSPTAQGNDIAIRRMEQAGAEIAGTTQVLAELAVDWSSPNGKIILPKMQSLMPS